MATLVFFEKRVFIYGLGKSGFALAAALYADGAEVYVHDSMGLKAVMQTSQGQKLFAKSRIHFVEKDELNFKGMDAFFKSPGIDMKDKIVQKAIKEGLPIMGDVDLLYRREPNAMFIGITGTNGKSTTTALIGHILEQSGKKVAVGGNLGTACLNLPTEQDIYVLELSSYQLETMYEAKMNIAVLLNLTPDHLKRHGGMAGYLSAKARIFNNEPESIAVIGVDNKELQNLAKGIKNPVTVSVEGNEAILHVGECGTLYEETEKVANLKGYEHLPGKHNWQNIACAYGALRGLVHLETFKKGVASFKNLPHRMEKVGHFKGVNFYNDSKATNPESTIKALESFDNIFWICGGEAKDEGITPCLEHLEHVQGAFVIGTQRAEIVRELEAHIPVADCETMEKAVYSAWQKIEALGLEDATILLSPACASWDQFDSFEHRGDVFVSLCHELISRLKGE